MKKVVITTGIVAIAGGLATAVFMPSCEPECDVEAKPSVIVRLVDQDAAGATLTQVRADRGYVGLPSPFRRRLRLGPV